MKRIMILDPFIFILIIMWIAGTIYGDIPKKENNALHALFNDTGGNGWHHKDNWKNAPGTEHTWYGLKCDTGNRTIQELELPGNNLQGKLPQDLEALVNLTVLDLSNNRLTGAIPPWLQQLKHLKKLNLSQNRFQGPIPTWIGNLENLEELLLDDNLLEGPIPVTLGNLSKLRILRIGSNGLTGEIPPALSKLSQLMNNNSNFKWNGLYTTNAGLGNFLKQKQYGNDWKSTQTIAPGEIEVVSQTETSISLSWKPIAYTQDKGGYRISYSVAPGGPYKKFNVTGNKTISKMKIDALKKSTVYYFVLEAWTEPHGMNKNKIESGLSKEFRTATRGIIISGIVTKYSDQKKSQTEALQGARMVASNNGGTTETDKNGKYNLNVMPGWAGTVTPSSDGFDFAPRDRFYSTLEADNGNQDFIGTPNTVVSGKMTYEGKGIDGVEIIFESIKGKTFFTETGEVGDYEYILPYNWMGIVIPKKEGHQFRPKQKVYGGITAQLKDENFMIEFPAISGRVTKSQSKSGLPGVTVTFSHINMDKFKYLKEYTVTDSEGHYINHIPTDWSGGIRPSKKGFIFYPRSEDNLTDDIDSPVDFKAERDFHLFFLLSGNFMLPAESRFNKIYAKSLIFPGLTAGYKFNRHFYAWGGYSFFSKNGKSEIFKKPTIWKQSYLSLGLGYYRNKSIRVAWRIGLGAIYVNFSEAAFGDKVSSNVFGGSIEAAGIYKVGQRLFMEFLLGYRVAAKTVNETNVTLGGFSTALGLGLKL